MLIATGRLALLVLAGFALKYLWKLHTVHAEQSVIYRDRLAALGIAESLLKATPELEQRREMLKSLTNVYLDFDESAFGKHRKDTEHIEDQGSVDGQIKRLSKVTEAVASLLDPVAKLLDRARDKTK